MNKWILLYLSLMALSCSSDKQSCESISGHSYSHYAVENIELGNRYLTSYGSDGLNEGNEVVDFEKFYMEIYFTSGTYAYSGPNQTGDLIRIEDWLDHCAPDRQGYVQQIEDIIFTTNLEYNDEFKAGDNINSLIVLNKEYENPPISLSDFLAEADKPVNYINTYYLNEEPTASKSISISVEVFLSNGGHFETTALPITFN